MVVIVVFCFQLHTVLREWEVGKAMATLDTPAIILMMPIATTNAYPALSRRSRRRDRTTMRERTRTLF